MTTQLVTPNPDIACQPGWCLQYVRQTFGAPVIDPTATAAWNASRTQHPDLNFPAGCWVPIWFSLADEPAGHVALMCPDGSVYSTSDLGTVPHHHPSLDDLLNYYAYYGKPLTYLGWTEDIEGVAVVDAGSINFQSVTPPAQAAPEGFLMALSDAEQRALYNNLDYVASAQFKADIFSGTTDLEKGARQAFHKESWTTPVPNILTGGSTSPWTEISWLPKNVNTLGNLIAAAIAAIKGQPAATQVAAAPIDVQALAADLAPLLNASQVEAFMAAMRAQINK